MTPFGARFSPYKKFHSSPGIIIVTRSDSERGASAWRHVAESKVPRVLSVSKGSGEQISLHCSAEWWDGCRCCDEVW